MKKLVFLMIAIMVSFSVNAQMADEARISVTPVMPEYGNIPTESQNFLFTKLQRIITYNGMVESSGERFVLIPRVDIIESGVTSAGMMLLKIEVTFIFGDVIENKIYGSATINLTGIAESEQQCYTKAFQVLKQNHPTLVSMLNKAKMDIIEYYTENSDFIIKEIERLFAMGEYEEAMTKALTVPSICKDIYMLCQDKALQIYETRSETQKQAEIEAVNKQGLILLQQARSAWAVTNDYDSAQKALDLIAQIDPYAACRADADTLLAEIDDILRAREKANATAAAAKEKAEWEFKMRKYEDDLAMAKQKQADKSAILKTLAGRYSRIDINIQKDITKRWVW